MKITMICTVTIVSIELMNITHFQSIFINFLMKHFFTDIESNENTRLIQDICHENSFGLKCENCRPEQSNFLVNKFGEGSKNYCIQFKRYVVRVRV